MPLLTTPAAASLDLSGPQARQQVFSLVIGGPLHYCLRRIGVSDEGLHHVHRRVILALLVMWAPLMVLSGLDGGLIGPDRKTPFLTDIGFQLRFLVVAPLLIVSEVLVHRLMQPVIDEFRTRDLIPEAEMGRFVDAFIEADRWRNSIAAEVAALVFIYVVGILFTLDRYTALGADAWYAAPQDGVGPSWAGLWLLFVSLPLLQFLMLRWYFRLFIWARFLWRVSRLDLRLDVTHPDKACGLGFLSDSLIAFIPIAAAHGVLFAGMIADRILYTGAKLTDFELEVAAGAVFLVLVFAGPLLLFSPRLAEVKLAGLRDYGALAQVYVRGFRAKWLAARARPGETILGSADIQSLADLGNSYNMAEDARIAPIRPVALLYFLAAFMAPILPLVLTMTSPDKLIGRLLAIIF